MQGEEARSRALRGTTLVFANGVSQVFLAVLVTAYGSETPLPFTSAEEFLAVATAWVSGPTGGSPAWVLGYLGVLVVLLSPVWGFVLRPQFGDTLGIGRTEPTDPEDREREMEESEEEREDENEVTEDEEDTEPARTTGEETDSDFIWGAASEEKEEQEFGDQTEEDTEFVWDGSSEGRPGTSDRRPTTER